MSIETDTAVATAGLAPATGAHASAAPAQTADVVSIVRGPGARLRAAREARHLGLQQVTDQLHIEPRLIEAMEADDFAAFDAPVYARGFLRKYSTFLELPAQEIVDAYERLHSGPGTPTLIPPATAEEPQRDWSTLKLAGAFAGVVVLVGGSYWWWLSGAPAFDARTPAAASAVVTSPTDGAQVVATPVATEAVPVAGESAASGPESTAGGVAAAVPADASAGSAPGAGGPDTVATPSGGAAPAAIPPAQAGSVTTTAAGVLAPSPTLPSGAALEIDFVGECWVEVVGPSGQRLMYDLGRPGESRALPGPGPWRVSLGAADAARLRLSGRPVIVPAANRFGATARFVVGPDGAVQ